MTAPSDIETGDIETGDIETGDIETGDIKDWHAHVYFAADTLERATALYARIEAAFPQARMGRIHEKPVGPHPEWSYQVAFEPDQLASILPWLTLNRDGLDILVHPNTGDDLTDHRDRAMFLGRSYDLVLDALT